jgi:hypothetical protein
VLGIPVLKVVIQVVAGRNIAVLVEAAVRNTILQLRGIDTYQEFVERHRKAMEREASHSSALRARRALGAGCGAAVRAVRLGAVGVQAQRVVGDLEALGLGHQLLALLDLGVVELLDLAAIQAHQVVVVLPSLSS